MATCFLASAPVRMFFWPARLEQTSIVPLMAEPIGRRTRPLREELLCHPSFKPLFSSIIARRPSMEWAEATKAGYHLFAIWLMALALLTFTTRCGEQLPSVLWTACGPARMAAPPGKGRLIY